MKTSIVNISPEVAKKLLESNTGNRPVKPSHVQTLRASFERGEYVTTHQGIAIGDDGVLIDGQHRLLAISLLPENFSFPMLVTTGLKREDVFPVTDATQAKRTTSDVLGVERSFGEVANFFAKLYAARTTGITAIYARPFLEWSMPVLEEMSDVFGKTCKTWSSAPVKSAAIVAVKTGNDVYYVKKVYRALVHADFDSMPPVAQAVFRSHMNGKVNAGQSYDIFCRCLKVFDPKNSNLVKVQINDQSRLIRSVREMLSEEVFDLPKKQILSTKKYFLDGL